MFADWKLWSYEWYSKAGGQSAGSTIFLTPPGAVVRVKDFAQGPKSNFSAGHEIWTGDLSDTDSSLEIVKRE